MTINKEAKGVPSSLYIDLLRKLPRKKTDIELLEERVADISRELTRNVESVFCQRIVSTTSPRAGQVSLTNFARRLRLILHGTNGILGTYTLPEQVQIIENYFAGIQQVYPDAFRSGIFFRTVGFGALWRAFPWVFSAAIREYSGFRIGDVANVFARVVSFDFAGWKRLGTGSAAEIQAGDDLIAELKAATETGEGSGYSIRL